MRSPKEHPQRQAACRCLVTKTAEPAFCFQGNREKGQGDGGGTYSWEGPSEEAASDQAPPPRWLQYPGEEHSRHLRTPTLAPSLAWPWRAGGPAEAGGVESARGSAGGGEEADLAGSGQVCGHSTHHSNTWYHRCAWIIHPRSGGSHWRFRSGEQRLRARGCQ